MARIDEFADGAEPQQGALRLTVPQLHENGNLVPLSISVDSPMTDRDYVESVAVFADNNPNPEVIVFNFTPLSGAAAATTRMRLARSQNVIAVAKTSTGAVFIDRHAVEVTVGSCSG